MACRLIGNRLSRATSCVLVFSGGLIAIPGIESETVGVLAIPFVATPPSPWLSFAFSDSDNEELDSESDSSIASRSRLAFASSITACV